MGWRKLTSDFHQSNWSSSARLAAPALPIAVVTCVRLAVDCVTSVRLAQETTFAGTGAGAPSGVVVERAAGRVADLGAVAGCATGVVDDRRVRRRGDRGALGAGLVVGRGA